jgi:hypothetical protein
MQRYMLILVGVIFLLVAAVHVVRVFLDVSVVIGGWVLPVWISVPAALVLILLAYLCFRAAGK